MTRALRSGLALLVATACATPGIRRMNVEAMEHGYRDQLNLGADPGLFEPKGNIEPEGNKMYFKNRVVVGDKNHLTVIRRDDISGGVMTFISDTDEDGVVDYVRVIRPDPSTKSYIYLFEVFNLPGVNSAIRADSGAVIIVHDDGGIFPYQDVRDFYAALILGEKL